MRKDIADISDTSSSLLIMIDTNRTISANAAPGTACNAQ